MWVVYTRWANGRFYPTAIAFLIAILPFGEYVLSCSAGAEWPRAARSLQTDGTCKGKCLVTKLLPSCDYFRQ
jgi:hypothetical protein